MNILSADASLPAGAPVLCPSRRTFLRYASAASAGAALVLAGCKSSDDPTPDPTITVDKPTIGLGSGDVALLNLLQASRQLTSALLQQILSARPADLPTTEADLLTAIRDHEVLHRDFLPVAINTLRTAANTASLALAGVTPVFSTFTLTTRTGALAALRTLLDLVGAGQAGMSPYIQRGALVTLSGRMQAVNQRHAAAVADLLTPDAVLDAPDATAPALSRALKPSAFIAALNPYLAAGSKLVTGSLP